MTRRRCRALRVLVGPALLLGCSLPSTTQAVRVDAPVIDPAAKAGGTLRVGVERPQTLDPAFVQGADQAAGLVARAMCEPLIGVDPQTKELRPAVVRSWKVLDDGAELQLTLDPRARFSDGHRVTATDVLDSLRRVIDPAVGSPNAPLLSHLLGYDAVQEGRTRPSSVPGLDQVTGSTVSLAFDRRDASFLYALTLPFAMPVEGARGLRTATQAPVCAGPYRLQPPTSPSTIGLVRSTAYGGTQPALARSGAGFADRVVFTTFANRTAALAALQHGDVDVATAPNDALPGLRGRGLVPLTTPTGVLEYIGLPTRAPFDNPTVRTALAAALDRTAIVDGVYAGARVPARGFLPPTAPDSLDPRPPACTRTLGDARPGPATATLPSTTAVPLYFNDEFHNRALVTAVAAAWKPLGLVVTPTPTGFDDLLSRGSSATGFDGPFRMAAVATSPDPVAFVTSLVGSQGIGSTNLTGFSNQGLERQLDRQLAQALGARAFRAAYAPVADALCTLLPVIPVAWGEAVFAAGPHALPAAHGGLDRSAALVDLREIAVR